MNQYKSCAELKDMAKGKLERNYGAAITTVLTVEFTYHLATNFLMMLIPTTTLIQFIIYRLILGALSVFLGIFEVGLSLFFLNLACGQPYRLDNIFYGFQNNSVNALIVSLVKNGLSALTSLPLLVCARLYFETQSPTYLIGVAITAVVGFLIYYPISLAISQSFFLLLDFPEYTGREALAASMKLMKKHMGRLLYMQISFLPLMLLCLCTCNIGFLWLTPYMNMTYTLFFLDIMKNREFTV